MKNKKNVQSDEPIADTVSENPAKQRVTDFLQNVLEKMGLNCQLEAAELDGTLQINVVGEDASAVIGYRGETLDALQYLCSLMHNGEGGGFKRVVLDAENYRSKREKALQRLASNLEQKVKRTGKAAVLEPMNPYERRVIHTSLQGSKYVTTQSEGEGLGRHVVVSPVAKNDILNSPSAPRKTLNFVYRSEKKRRR